MRATQLISFPPSISFSAEVFEDRPLFTNCDHADLFDGDCRVTEKNYTYCHYSQLYAGPKSFHLAAEPRRDHSSK